jgi:GH43 family beta-xylosidase
MSKQTAVKWYSNAVNAILIARQDNKIDDELFIQNLLNAKLQAKQIEKQQIKDAYDMGYLDYQNLTHDSAEQYYKETYGGQNEN